MFLYICVDNIYCGDFMYSPELMKYIIEYQKEAVKEEKPKVIHLKSGGGKLAEIFALLKK